MIKVVAVPPPEQSLIAAYARVPGHYADAYRADAPRDTGLPDFITAFYTTPLFRAERTVLSLAGLSSRDADVARLAAGTGEEFAAWRVEARRADEVLLVDVSGRTRSWLAVERTETAARLWFGSVVVPAGGGEGPERLGPAFTLLLGAHRVYSRGLLAAAARRLAGHA